MDKNKILLDFLEEYKSLPSDDGLPSGLNNEN